MLLCPDVDATCHNSLMHERDWSLSAPQTEARNTPLRGELFFLWHRRTDDIFSGYGLTTRGGLDKYLIGIPMVDRSRPADPEWLKEVEEAYGQRPAGTHDHQWRKGDRLPDVD
jgi:hypothetical protein